MLKIFVLMLLGSFLFFSCSKNEKQKNQILEKKTDHEILSFQPSIQPYQVNHLDIDTFIKITFYQLEQSILNLENQKKKLLTQEEDALKLDNILKPWGITQEQYNSFAVTYHDEVGNYIATHKAISDRMEELNSYLRDLGEPEWDQSADME